MKWLRRPLPFHLFNHPCVINRLNFGQGMVIYYVCRDLQADLHLLLLEQAKGRFYPNVVQLVSSTARSAKELL